MDDRAEVRREVNDHVHAKHVDLRFIKIMQIR